MNEAIRRSIVNKHIGFYVIIIIYTYIHLKKTYMLHFAYLKIYL